MYQRCLKRVTLNSKLKKPVALIIKQLTITIKTSGDLFAKASVYDARNSIQFMFQIPTHVKRVARKTSVWEII